MKRSIALRLALLAASGATFGAASTPLTLADEVRVGTVPALPALRTTAGATLAPGDLRGKVVVISYFSSGCPFCMHEAPKLQKLYRDHPGRIVVIGVNVDTVDPAQRSRVAQWIDKYGITHPVSIDYAAVAAVLGKPKGLPVNFVLDRSGRLVRVDVGEIFDEDFEEIAAMARAG